MGQKPDACSRLRSSAGLASRRYSAVVAALIVVKSWNQRSTDNKRLHALAILTSWSIGNVSDGGSQEVGKIVEENSKLHFEHFVLNRSTLAMPGRLGSAGIKINTHSWVVEWLCVVAFGPPLWRFFSLQNCKRTFPAFSPLSGFPTGPCAGSRDGCGGVPVVWRPFVPDVLCDIRQKFKIETTTHESVCK